MKKIGVLVLVCCIAAFSLAGKEVKGRYAVILQAGAETGEGVARAVHALLYARELAENGYQVVLVFDGAGTGWAEILRDPDHPLHKHYAKIRELGMTEEICDYCAEKFDVKDSLSERQKKLLNSEYEGHPSLVKWIEKGYMIVVL